jgi:hypothetical protein
MKLLINLLPLALSVSAFSNLALRYDELEKRATNESYAFAPAVESSSASVLPVTTSQIVTEIPTVIPTVDANGVSTTLYVTTTITYYTTIEGEAVADAAAITSSSAGELEDDEESTITSTILTTITLADGSVTTEASDITAVESYTTDSQGNTITVLNKNGDIFTESDSASVSASASASDLLPSSTSDSGTVTVTETVYPSTCAELTTFVNKVPILATFTITGSNGEEFTVSTSTDVEQTSTETINITSTVNPSFTDPGHINSTITSTIENTSYYGNATISS